MVPNSKNKINVVDNLTSTSAKDALSAKQGKALNEKKQDKNLIKEIKLTSPTNTIIIDDLDILADGGVYEIIATGVGESGADSGLKVNSVNTGYYEKGEFGFNENAYSSEYSSNADKFYFSRIDNVYFSAKSILIYNSELKRVTIFSENINKSSGNLFIRRCYGYLDVEIDNVTNITISADQNFTEGTCVKIYKK